MKKIFTARRKSIISILLVICLLLGMIPVSAKAENREESVKEYEIITPSDFGIPDGLYAKGTPSREGTYGGYVSHKSGETVDASTLNGKMFQAVVNFKDSGAYLRYGGGNSGWHGLQLYPTGNNLCLQDVLTGKSGVYPYKEFTPEKAGCRLVGNHINLAISTAIGDYDGQGEQNDLKIGVYFDDKLYDDEYIYWYDYLTNNADNFANNIRIYPASGDLYIASPKRTLDEYARTYITMEDFQGTVQQEGTVNVTENVSGIYDNSLDGVVCSLNVKYTGTGGYICYAGNSIGSQNNMWDAIRFSVSAAGMMVWQATGYFTDRFLISAAKEGEIFELQISTEYVDYDWDGMENDVRLGVWINGELAENRYIYLHDYADSYMGNSILLYGGPQDSGNSLSYSTGEWNIQTKAVCYDLESGPYLATGDVLTLDGNSVENGTEIAEPGDHIIVCETGARSYTQPVSLYKTGDANCDGAINVRDLVSMKKLLNGTNTSLASQKASDLNNHNDVEEADLEIARRILVGDASLEKIKETYQTDVYSYEFIGGNEVMPIGGHYGPYTRKNMMLGYVYWSKNGQKTEDATGRYVPDYVTDEYFGYLADAGINMVNQNCIEYTAYGAAGAACYEKMLQLGEKYGIGIYISDDALIADQSRTKLVEQLGKYAHYSSFLGIHIVDEPKGKDNGLEGGSAGIIQEYSTLALLVNRYCNLDGYINLKGMGTLIQYYYDDYLAQYVDNCNPNYISFDRYPFHDSSNPTVQNCNSKTRYFKNLDKVRTKAQETGIPFWAYVQAGGDFRDGYETGATDEAGLPSKSETLWNVNTCLAFGAKGIEWFPLIQPEYFSYVTMNGTDSVFDCDRNGLIGADGSKTRFYAYARRANSWIRTVDAVLMKAKSLAIVTDPGGSYAYQNLKDVTDYQQSYGILKKVSSDNTDYGAMVGYFDYFGKPALYVVNYHAERTGESGTDTIILEFDKEYAYSGYVQNTDLEQEEAAYEVSGNGSSCALTLEQGAAALILFEP